MKSLLHLFLPALFLLACNNTNHPEEQELLKRSAKYIPPASGTVIAADSMKAADELNRFYFAVKILSNKYSTYGSYDVIAHYGPNEATSAFSFPKAGRNIMPVLRKGKEPYTYIVGFYWDNDPNFYDYYLISGSKGKIIMKYIKAYSFQ